MRVIAMTMVGLLAASAASAEESAAATVALINARLASDPFYATDGYSIALPSACVVELIPRGRRLGTVHNRRIGLQVLDRSAAGRLDYGDRRQSGYAETWLHLTGRPEGTAVRQGFPTTPRMNEKGFPKDPEVLLSYGIELRFGHHDSAREVAQAFVYLATLCLDSQ